MPHTSSGFVALCLVVASFASGTASAQVYKCVDERTGGVSYSQVVCHGHNRGGRINLSENSLDTSGSRRQAALLQHRQQQQEAQLAAETARHEAESRMRSTASGRGPGDRELCEQMKKPIPGAHGMTAAQRRAVLAACGGIHLPEGAEEYSPQAALPVYGHQPPVPPGPRIITSCDEGGCWGTSGDRYNRGAGTTFFPGSGGPACQMIGTQMHCP